jgi:hypothetical protein
LWFSFLIICLYIWISIVITKINCLYSSLPTERRDRKGNTFAVYSGDSGFKSRLLDLLYWFFWWFSSFPPN